MRRVLKWVGIGVLSFAGVIAVAVGVLYMVSGNRLGQKFMVQPKPLAVVDTPSVAHGRHMAIAIGKCVDCHGADLGGAVFIDAPPLGRLYGSNLTGGKGGILGTYTDADLVRAIRHGVRPDGSALLFMPAQEYQHMSDRDLADLIAYLRSSAPVDREGWTSTVGPIGRMLYVTGKLPLVPAELIAHDAPRPTAPTPGATVEYGQYLARVGGCFGCHGEDLKGGIEHGPPGTPPSTDITANGAVKGWTEAQFVSAMRTGVRPNGVAIHPFMPWKYVGQMTDEEMTAMWRFLQTTGSSANPQAR